MQTLGKLRLSLTVGTCALFVLASKLCQNNESKSSADLDNFNVLPEFYSRFLESHESTIGSPVPAVFQDLCSDFENGIAEGNLCRYGIRNNSLALNTYLVFFFLNYSRGSPPARDIKHNYLVEANTAK